MQLPRLLVKDEAQAAGAAGGAAEAAGARPAKPVAARVELEGGKRLPEGASWRWGEPGDEACRMGGTGWGVYGEGSVAEAAQGGGALTRLVGMTPPLVWWTPLPNGFGSMHPRGEGRESRRSGDLTWWWLSRMPPPPPRGKGQTPAPKPSAKPSKVAKVAAQPPHEALDVEALSWGPVWPPT